VGGKSGSFLLPGVLKKITIEKGKKEIYSYKTLIQK
jgi:hypothetical protein